MAPLTLTTLPEVTLADVTLPDITLAATLRTRSAWTLLPLLTVLSRLRGLPRLFLLHLRGRLRLLLSVLGRG